MAHNLSSNQQYLLSMVQQNNPEILSKFLNEDRDDPLGAYRMMKDKGNYSPEQQAAYDAAEARRNAPGSKYTGKVADYKVGEGVVTGENTSPSTQSKVALRYQKKAEENKLPFGDRPISPFYKTTRNQFRAEFGRDFDASGGATPANMRGLVNIKTNLAGRLEDIESAWQDKMAWEAQLAAGQKYKNPFAKMAATLVAKTKAEKENPVHDYVASDFDVPEIRRPGEPEGTERTLPTQPVDTGRKTEWIFSDQYKSDTTDKTQASNLSGKSVNQKINRIA